METITIEIKKGFAMQVLENLEKLDAISFLSNRGKKRREFKAISISTKGYKFNREEANER